MDEENNIPLAGVDVGVFKQEHSVHAIILQNRELDEETNWPCKAFAHDEVLLSPDLEVTALVQKGRWIDTLAMLALLTPSRRLRRSRRALSLI